MRLSIYGYLNRVRSSRRRASTRPPLPPSNPPAAATERPGGNKISTAPPSISWGKPAPRTNTPSWSSFTSRPSRKGRTSSTIAPRAPSRTLLSPPMGGSEVSRRTRGCDGKGTMLFCTEANHAADLKGTHAFLGSHHEMRHGKPCMQRNLTALIERANGHGEGLTASVALIEAGTVRLASHERGLIDNTAMRTGAAVRPNPCFKPFAGMSAWLSFYNRRSPSSRRLWREPLTVKTSRNVSMQFYNKAYF
jgi:hypothetical protein